MSIIVFKMRRILWMDTGSGIQLCLLTPYHISSKSPTINPHPLILLLGLGPRKLSSATPPTLCYYWNKLLVRCQRVGERGVGEGGSKMAPRLRTGLMKTFLQSPQHTLMPCLSPVLYGSSGVFINILNGFVRPTVRIGSLIGFPN